MNQSAPGLDREARFRAAFERNYRAVLGYALRRTDEPEDAADVVAETFLIAWRRFDDLPRADGERPWLYGVARRVLANSARAGRRRESLAERLRLELPVPVPDPFDGPPCGALADAFRALPEQDREVLRLAAWEGLDSAGSATVLGCSPTAARIRLHRARRRLARELAGRGVETKHAVVAGQSPKAMKANGPLPEDA